MKNGTVNISTKTFVWILAVILTIIVLIIGFNQLDKKRKFNQFVSLNNKLTPSNKYIERFDLLLIYFDSADSVVIKKLSENLALMEKDEPDIDDAELFILDSYGIYKISSMDDFDNGQYIKELNYLPSDVEKVKKYMDNNEQVIPGKLYELTESEHYISTIIKLRNGYLRVSKNRW